MVSSFLRFLDHTQRRSTVGRTPLEEWSARRRDLYLTEHNTHNRQISMPPVGFEPTISAGERPQTYALDRAATGTGISLNVSYINLTLIVIKHRHSIAAFVAGDALCPGSFWHLLPKHKAWSFEVRLWRLVLSSVGVQCRCLLSSTSNPAVCLPLIWQLCLDTCLSRNSKVSYWLPQDMYIFIPFQTICLEIGFYVDAQE